MSNFRPSFNIVTEETLREYRNDYSNKKGRYKTISAPTYRELKKLVKIHLPESVEGEVVISRSRRGEWGEWFEVWQMVNGKAQIVRQGWQ